MRGLADGLRGACETGLCETGRAPNVRTMTGFLIVLMVLAMAGTLGVLFAGMLGLARGGDPRRSNRLMQWRVILQAAALLLFLGVLSLLRR